MIRSLGFMTGWAMVIGILVLIGTGCPPTDPGVRVFLSKAAQGSGCEGCTPSGPALLINDGAVSTDELVVTLAVSGTDAPPSTRKRVSRVQRRRGNPIPKVFPLI